MRDLAMPDLAAPDLACAPPRALCNGVCIDLTNDPRNCGDCGVICIASHGTNPCIGGVCSPQCDATHIACGAPSGGCDTDQTTDTNCGGCAIGCMSPSLCMPSGGQYTCLSCADRGLLQCAGACVDATSDAMNCGGCGQACPGGTCVGGYCKSCSLNALPAVLSAPQIGLLETCAHMKPGATVDVSFRGSWCFNDQTCSAPLWVNFALEVTGATCGTMSPACDLESTMGLCSPPATLTATVPVPANGRIDAQIQMIRCSDCNGDGACGLQTGSYTFTAR
jgi:hypothetical protein